MTKFLEMTDEEKMEIYNKGSQFVTGIAGVYIQVEEHAKSLKKEQKRLQKLRRNNTSEMFLQVLDLLDIANSTNRAATESTMELLKLCFVEIYGKKAFEVYIPHARKKIPEIMKKFDEMTDEEKMYREWERDTRHKLN